MVAGWGWVRGGDALTTSRWVEGMVVGFVVCLGCESGCIERCNACWQEWALGLLTGGSSFWVDDLS